MIYLMNDIVTEVKVVKNKKQLIWIVGAALAILAIAATIIIIICNKPDEKKVDANTLFPFFVSEINIIENGATQYYVVYAETASQEVITAANNIINEVTKLTGVTLNSATDTDLPPDNKYIIVGDTTLDDSIKVKATINNAADSFVITATENGNIVILSNYEDKLEKATGLFTGTIIKNNYNPDTKTLAYEGYYEQGKDNLPDGYKLAELKKSKIVYATNLDGYRAVAETLRHHIKTTYNVDVPVYPDEGSVPSAREILIGETNRDVSQTYYETKAYIMEYDVMVENGSIQILSGGSFSARKAVEELCEKLLNEDNAKKTLEKGSYTNNKMLANALPKNSSTDARLMTLNIMPYVLGEAAYANILPIRERVEIFAGILISYQPDVIGLQEADFKWQEQIPYYIDVLNEYYDLGYEFVLHTYNGKNVYCPMIYRADKYDALVCKYNHYDYHTSSANANDRYIRGASQLVLQNKNDAGEKFVAINAHWDHGGQTTTANPQYMNECAQHEAAIVKNCKLEYPGTRIFCLGDFNSHRYNGVFFDQFCADIDGKIASEVARESGTLKASGGYHAGSAANILEDGTRSDCKPTMNKFIDHIIFTSSDESTKTSVLRHDTLFATDGYCHILSDHCAVYADFEFTEG